MTSVILHDIGKAQDVIYQLQELRHASSSSHTIQINDLFASLGTEIERISNVLSGPALKDGHDGGSEQDVENVRVQEEWQDLNVRWTRLKAEMREDGWLVRFRTTAEQAEAMMDSLEKSLDDLSQKVKLAESEGIEESAPQLTQAIKAHVGMRQTYATSIAKIIKMMNRSLSDRATKNGKAIRRLGDMESRWKTLQSSLIVMEGRARLVLEQQEGSKGKEVEVDKLVGALSLNNRSDLDSPRASPPSHPLPTAPGTSSLALPPESLYPPLGTGPTLRRRDSQTTLLSTTTAATNANRPRWNASTKVTNSSAAESTPFKRRLTVGSSTTPSIASRSVTPVGPAAVQTPSRIPAPRARPSLPNRMSVGSGHSVVNDAAAARSLGVTPRKSIPGLSVSTTSSRITLSDPTTVPPVPSLPAVPIRTPSRPRASLANATPLFKTPRNPRASLARGPPSAYRPSATTPPSASSHIPPVPRPASRMSTSGRMSVAGSSYAGGSNSYTDLQPFEPSKYDLLDQHIAQAILDHDFQHFVGRLDPPLRKGQIKGKDEEWKGTFVFGHAAEKGMAVKMVQLAARGMGAGEERVNKCLVKKGGQWLPLGDILNERKAKYDEVF